MNRGAVLLLMSAFLIPAGLAGAHADPVGTANEEAPLGDTIPRQIEPQEFVGRHTTDASRIGDSLYVRHTYSSDELRHLGVDHVFREEIVSIPPTVSDEDVSRLVENPVTRQNHTMTLVHEDDDSALDRILAGTTEVSVQAFEQWNIVKAEKKGVRNTAVGYWQASHVEDWASKGGHAYRAHDPINLIWSDTASEPGTLISKVTSKMRGSGWNGLCPPSDLYVNIGGTWTSQDESYSDQLGILCDQYHARAWVISDNLVIGSAHKEVGAYKLHIERIDMHHISRSGPNYVEYDIPTSGGFYHSVTGFETAEGEAAGEFTGGCWRVAEDSHDLGNQYTRKMVRDGTVEHTAYNDGYATIINCS